MSKSVSVQDKTLVLYHCKEALKCLPVFVFSRFPWLTILTSEGCAQRFVEVEFVFSLTLSAINIWISLS